VFGQAIHVAPAARRCIPPKGSTEQLQSLGRDTHGKQLWQARKPTWTQRQLLLGTMAEESQARRRSSHCRKNPSAHALVVTASKISFLATTAGLTTATVSGPLLLPAIIVMEPCCQQGIHFNGEGLFPSLRLHFQCNEVQRRLRPNLAHF
jgi:hypothetical protein